MSRAAGMISLGWLGLDQESVATAWRVLSKYSMRRSALTPALSGIDPLHSVAVWGIHRSTMSLLSTQRRTPSSVITWKA